MEEREKRKIIAEEKHKEWVQKKNEQVKRNANTCAYFTSLQCLSFALLCFPPVFIDTYQVSYLLPFAFYSFPMTSTSISLP